MDKCVYYYISRRQRETEVARGDGFEGTMGYEAMGCYNCDGFNKVCDTYSNDLNEDDFDS